MAYLLKSVKCGTFVSFQDVAYLVSVCAGQSVSSSIMTWICVTLELGLM